MYSNSYSKPQLPPRGRSFFCLPLSLSMYSRASLLFIVSNRPCISSLNSPSSYFSNIPLIQRTFSELIPPTFLSSSNILLIFNPWLPTHLSFFTASLTTYHGFIHISQLTSIFLHSWQSYFTYIDHSFLHCYILEGLYRYIWYWPSKGGLAGRSTARHILDAFLTH